MANFKESSGYCPHCQKRVVGRKEEASHTFWLIATLFSCGLFGIVWLISMLVKAGEPFKCSFCGTPLQKSPVAGTNNQFAESGTTSSSSKGAVIAVLVIIGVFVGLLVIGMAAHSTMKAARDAREARTEAMTADSAPKSFDSPANVPPATKKAPVRAKTKEQRIKAGVIEVNDANGEPRPYGVTCRLRLEQMDVLTDSRIPKGIRVAIFERCIELDGDAEAAVAEMTRFIETNR